MNAPATIKKYLLSLECTLMNRYNRQYSQSFDKQFRITLDTHLEFFLPSTKINTESPRSYRRWMSIIEIKYDEKHDDRIDMISSFFPFRMTKFSKYIDGMNSFYQ